MLSFIAMAELLESEDHRCQWVTNF